MESFLHRWALRSAETSFPVEQFDTIAGFVDEHEDGARKRILAKLLAHDHTQAIKTLTQITGFDGQADFDAMCKNHA